ncbi:helix-turn-helix domain-containing protein [Amaricoccus sp.]|uniref:helix-turn-helix domain-containing protein n=1 Tax=Amaricoccus sp. TaxID=1872485 RepID=UPI00262A5706|nr:helix-turn-helix domain-containing protein [Amaricoccus sp.]HRO10893.1 helix-turn-helix domain-containing protein [Amaricoccus sp.]
MRLLTTDAPSPRPVEVLQDELRSVCGLFSIEPRPQARGIVAGNVGRRRFGGVDTAIVSLDAERVVRDARSVRAEPGEHLFLLVQEVGFSRVVQGGAAAELTPGDMYLVDSVLPSEFLYPGSSTQVSLHFPRREMLGRFGGICTGGTMISREDPLLAAMRAVVVKMAVEQAAASVTLGEAFLGLLGAYFHCRQSQMSPRDRAASAVLSRALAMIDRRFRDPAFGPAELAERLNVSERTLQRHFQALGETASRRILAVRLKAAHAELVGARAAAGTATVAAIAFGSGFNDLSHFYREFRATYGVPPGAAMRGLAAESKSAGG